MSACVYQHFSNDGELLYIGISKNPKQRMKAHKCGSPWWKDIAEVRVQHYPSMEIALLVERVSIGSLAPRFNVKHNKRNIVIPDLTNIDPLLGFYPLMPMEYASKDERKRYLMLKKKYNLIKSIDGYGHSDPIGLARAFTLSVNTILSIIARVDQ